jgi:hypothetical protein
MLAGGRRGEGNVVSTSASLLDPVAIVALAADELDLRHILTEHNSVAVTKDPTWAEPSGDRRRAPAR